LDGRRLRKVNRIPKFQVLDIYSVNGDNRIQLLNDIMNIYLLHEKMSKKKKSSSPVAEVSDAELLISYNNFVSSQQSTHSSRTNYHNKNVTPISQNQCRSQSSGCVKRPRT